MRFGADVSAVVIDPNVDRPRAVPGSHHLRSANERQRQLAGDEGPEADLVAVVSRLVAIEAGVH